MRPTAGAEGASGAVAEASAKSTARSSFDDRSTRAAVRFENAPSAKVTVRSSTSFASACASAVPVSVTVTTVSLVRANAAVSPAGTFAAVT